MLTPPTGLSDGDVKGAIAQAWVSTWPGSNITPLGFGSHHWVATDDRAVRYFVTVDELSSESRTGDGVSVQRCTARRGAPPPVGTVD